MPRFEETPSKKRVLRAKHLEPGEFQLDYILLPIGYAYNSEWVTAKKGEKVSFFDGGTYRIYAVRRVRVKGGLAEVLSRMRYGISIAGCIQRWKDNARMEGHAPAAVSSEECLWVIYEKAEG